MPSRLIGATVMVRVRAETPELYQGTAHLLTLPRRAGQHRQRIDYRHLSWSLVRKPGAFAQYRYRDELFPTLAFRQAYARLVAATARADREYVRLLHLAASTSEAEVDAALDLLLEQQTTPFFDRVRALVQPPGALTVPVLAAPVLDLGIYDRLLTAGGDDV